MTRQSVLASLLGSFLVAASTCGADDVFTYQTDGAQQFEVTLVDAEGSFAVLEADRQFERKLTFFGSDGEQISQESTERFRMQGPNSFLLVDRFHIALPLLNEPNKYDLSPGGPTTGSNRSVIAWLNNAGGLLSEQSGDTNALVESSCAVAADGSIGMWRHDSPEALRASPPGAFDNERFHLADAHCLAADGSALLAVVAIDRRPETPRWRRGVVHIYEAGASAPQTTLLLGDEARPSTPAPSFSAVGDHLIAMQTLRGRANGGGSDWRATRVVRRAGQWMVERATLGPDWPERLSIFAFRDNEVWVREAPNPSRIVAVPWEPGVAVIPFAPRRSIDASTPFLRRVFESGYVVFSPNADRVLWVDSAGEIRAGQVAR